MKKVCAVTLVMLVTILSGCASGSNFVSVERKFREEKSPTGYHHVARGETLYSIAWRYGIDYRELASANSISSPYTIYPGQKIDVSGRRKYTPVAKPTSVGKPTKAPVVNTAPAPVVAETSHYSPVPEVINESSSWQWPANGRVIARFSTKEPVNKGIDIAGALGESVLAAAAGTVVYAGQGLRGYGNLVIIKHNDTYLSAYAHASRILVSEQEAVKAGQKIAEIGSTGTDGVKLHFEIRQNGKPVDPLQYLPGR